MIIFALLFWGCFFACVCGVVFVILSLIKIFYKKITWKFVVITTALFPIGFIVLAFIGGLIYNFCTTPMTVRKIHINGNYVINRDLFKGENADWQYEHYWINISNDTLYLNVMNNGALIKTYQRPITYMSKGKHTFIEFYDENDFKNSDSIVVVKKLGNHHTLENNPLLHADPFSFNIVLQSTKYKNMFFKKGEWESNKKE